MQIDDLPARPDRRAVLAGGSVLALAPLAASLASGAQAADAPVQAGGYDFDTPYPRLGTDCSKWDQAVRDEGMDHIVAGMGIADMDFRCAPAITRALRERIAHENWGYNMLEFYFGTEKAADHPFVRAVVDWNRRRYGIEVIDPARLGISSGVHSGLVAAIRAFCPAGGHVLLATPIYGGFYGDIAFTRTVPEESEMVWNNGRFEIDWDDLARRMAKPEVRVTILCNPHNPTGRVWTREELTRYGELALKHDVVVLADEIHCDFVGAGRRYTPFSTLDPAIVRNSVTFKSGSKSFSLAAMKCAWFFSTNPDLFAAVTTNNHSEMTTLGIVAEQAALQHGEPWLDQCVAYIDANHAFANDYIAQHIPLIRVGARPEGTYLKFIDVSPLAEKIGAPRLAQLSAGRGGLPATPEEAVGHWMAQKAYVSLAAGSGFGRGGEGHMRMNIATSRRTLAAALDSLATACANA